MALPTLRSWGLPWRRVQHIDDSYWPVQQLPTDSTCTIYGQGRSYGDVALHTHGHIIHTQQWQRILAWNESEQWIEVEAGVTISQLLHWLEPKGWGLPVVPGTQWVSVGGAIANDVHGKNHPVVGGIGDHVLQFTLIRQSVQVVCSPAVHPKLFAATIGGLGLTGLITHVRLRIVRNSSQWFTVLHVPFRTIDECFELFMEIDRAKWPYAVAWSDCTNRHNFGTGTLTLGCRSARADSPKPRHRVTIPEFPLWPLVLRLGIPWYNRIRLKAAQLFPEQQTIPWETFYFPLDALQSWNRLYGRAGMYQFQCILPRAAFGDLLTIVQSARQRPYLSVLKHHGNILSPGMLSSLRPGFSIALDYANEGQKTVDLFRQLEEVVVAAGGIIYPAKDALMRPATFKALFPHWQQFADQYWDKSFTSDFWKRVTMG